MNALRRREIFRILAAERPDPESELHFSTPFELLVAVMLSAQATDKSVNAATEKLFPVASTPQDFVRLGEAGLIPYIRTIGLYKAKAKHVIETCRQLIERFGGNVPARFNDLVTLPGVGAKTANVVLNVAFHQPTIAVDTHIFRVANRTGLAPAKTPDAVSEKLLKVTPKEFLLNVHHWLLLHGRYCCTARKPHCTECPIAAFCEYPDKTLD